MFFKKKIILDTNFLMIPGELGIDIFSQIDDLMQEPYKLCVMKGTNEELKKLIAKSKNTKESLNAKLGYIMLKQKNLKTLTGSSDNVDDSIVEYAKNHQVIVATQDKELAKRLKEENVKTIALRQKKYLTLR